MKIKLLFVFFILLYVAILMKLFYVQVISRKFKDLNLYLKTEKLGAERGRIFDSNGNPLALNQNSYLLYIEPKKITDKFKLIHELADKLKMDESSLSAMIDDTKVYQSIKSGLTENVKDDIQKLELKGIGFNYEMKRYYPEASLSAHVLGFVGKSQDSEDIGYFGLEGYYDKDLKGLPGLFETERDINGKPIFIGTQNRTSAENGRDLFLTIDKSVEEIAKRQLLAGIERYKAKSGCVIIANPNTMAILALSCLPDYDLDKYYKFTQDFFTDPAITDVVEPGSIFKPLVMAAALNEGKIRPDDEMDETGQVKIGSYSIKTWDDTYEGVISMTRILEKSSNVGMVYIGDKLGNVNLYNYLKKFGLGEITGIDLQGESSGYLRPKNSWYPIDYATATFGQGLAITPIQMIRAFASLINGGNLMRPYVVAKMISSSGKETNISPKVERKVISPLTSEIIKKMLVSTVEHAEVKWDRPKGYQIGGKTGTAQIAISGYYDPSKTIASFIGFAPANKPKFITLVMLKEPGTSIWGSETAAPIFFNIAKELIVYYNIAPEQ